MLVTKKASANIVIFTFDLYTHQVPAPPLCKKLSNLATGVNVALQGGKALVMDGPSKKLDHLTMVMHKW